MTSADWLQIPIILLFFYAPHILEFARTHPRPEKAKTHDEIITERIKGIRIMVNGELDDLFRTGTIISQDVL